MAKITTVTNPLTGQPAQVDQLDHTAQQIDDGVARAIGFGLGGAAKNLTADDDLNNIWQAGWYAWDAPPKNAPTIPAIGLYGSYQSMLVMNKGGSYTFAQLVVTIDGFVFFRNVVGGASEEWGILNPPMNAGVEFRTTERWNGKPVYAKAVDFGALPNNTSKSVAHGITELATVLYANGSLGYGTLLGASNVTGINIDATNITITTKADLTGNVSYVMLKYCKTTD